MIKTLFVLSMLLPGCRKIYCGEGTHLDGLACVPDDDTAVEGDTDTDADADSDTDTDSDADADSDADSDADADADADSDADADADSDADADREGSCARPVELDFSGMAKPFELPHRATGVYTDQVDCYSSCAPGTGNNTERDIVYRVTTDRAATLSVTTSDEAGADPIITVHSASACGSPAELSCVDDVGPGEIETIEWSTADGLEARMVSINEATASGVEYVITWAYTPVEGDTDTDTDADTDTDTDSDTDTEL